MRYAIPALLFATVALGDCAADNCLRALRATQRLEAAQSFCATFTKTSVPATAIPTFAVNACKSNQVGSPSFRISSACSCLSTTTASPTTTSSTVGPTASGACATVSSLYVASRAASPAVATPTIPAAIAHACLESVPLGKDAALALVDSLEPYLEFQSDSAYKKDPPADYFYPPFDLFAKLASVKANLQVDAYVNEYAFQQDLYQVFAPGHDGHYVVYPDLLSKAFQWGRPRALVSISKDGTSIPEIFIYEDISASPKTAVAVTEINGIEAFKYVAEYAYTASFNQDADAAYNTMFFQKSFVAGGIGNGYFSWNGRVRYIYPGANTTFTYANGTELFVENVAYVKSSFDGVTDGPSFYQKFCTGPQATASIAAEEEAAAAIPGYPAPVIQTNDGVVSGYYLEGDGYDDVAVISLLAFESESPAEFQKVAEDFFAQAKAAGKTKLVIDLQANGGGYILQGYDLYRQLFPDIVQEDYTRIRENPYMLAMARSISDFIPDDYDPNTASSATIQAYEIFLNYRYDYNLTEQPFLTFEDKFAPHVFAGDNYTNIIRWNLNDPLTTSNTTYGFGTDITGYGSRTGFKQPFAAEDIIMLYDGYCASTCTLFSEFMRLQAGVKSVAFGGRPNTDPIQGVGGIKGAQVVSMGDIKSIAEFAMQLTDDEEIEATLSVLSDLPVNRSTATSVNLRDNILPNNLNDGIPAQFVREEADCRLFWTLEMVQDVTAVWKGAAAAAFNGASCVAGKGIEKRSEEEVKRYSERVLRRSVQEVERDALNRREEFKRMEVETSPITRAKFGKKIIQ